MTLRDWLFCALAFVVGFGVELWLRRKRARFVVPAPFQTTVFATVRHGWLTILGGAPSPRDKFVIDYVTSDVADHGPIMLTILDRSTQAPIKIVLFSEDHEGKIIPCADDIPPIGAEHELTISPAKGITLVGRLV